MVAAEVDDLSGRIHLTGLRGYWDAVARGTKDVISELSAVDLEATVDPARVNAAIRDEGALVPSGAWVEDFWGAVGLAVGSSCRPRSSTRTGTCTTAWQCAGWSRDGHWA